MSGQKARLFDIFALGPFMLWAASVSKSMPDVARIAMAFGGFATMTNNAKNYIATENLGVEVSKSQGMRLFNVLVNGPFLVWYASKAKELNGAPRAFAGLSGAATMAYNAQNYARDKK